MLSAKYSGRICRQCATEAATRHRSTGAGSSRGLATFPRRRQRRNLSGQASMWPSQAPIEVPWPFCKLPLPPYPPVIDWSWKGKERALEEMPDVIQEEVVEEVVGEAQRVKRRVDSDRAKLFARGTSSVSLNLLQQHLAELQTRGVSSRLSLLLWLLDQSRAPVNDVGANKRKWHVNVHRRAELEHRRGIKPKWGTVPTSIDLLCADLIKRGDWRDLAEDDLPLLRSLCFRALRKNAFRTLQAVENLVEEDELHHSMDNWPGSPAFYLSLIECLLIRHAKRGEWEEVWQKREDVLKLLRRQKKIGQLHNNPSDDWQLDIVLAKSLTAHCAHNYHAHQRDDTLKTHLDLAQDEFYVKHITELIEQIKDIYGKISAKWLDNLFLGLIRGITLETRRDNWSLRDYFDRLSITNLAQRLFSEYCQNTDSPSPQLMYKMLALEMNWEHHCRAHKGDVGKERMLQLAEKHHDNVESIQCLLSEHERRAASKKCSTSLHIRRQLMEDLHAKAYATEISIKLLLSNGDYKTALERLQVYLGTIRPEEDYYHLVGGERSVDLQSKQKTTAKAMAGTQRLTRGSFVIVALHLERYSVQDKVQAIPLLLRLIKESIDRGVWDPWPLRSDATRKRLRLLKMQPHLVDPCAALSRLCSRLLAMCRPVIPVHRYDVSRGYTVVDMHLSGTFCKVLEGIALLHKTMESRLALLIQKRLLTLGEDRTRSRITMRDIFVRNTTSAAQCVWSILANPSESNMITSRLEMLFEQVFLPLGLPCIGWTSVRRALKQRWPPHAHNRELMQQVHALFERTLLKRHEVNDKTLNKGMYTSMGHDGIDQAQIRAARRLLHRRERFNDKKRIAKEKRCNRAFQYNLTRW